MFIPTWIIITLIVLYIINLVVKFFGQILIKRFLENEKVIDKFEMTFTIMKNKFRIYKTGTNTLTVEKIEE